MVTLVVLVSLLCWAGVWLLLLLPSSSWEGMFWREPDLLLTEESRLSPSLVELLTTTLFEEEAGGLLLLVVAACEAVVVATEEL